MIVKSSYYWHPSLIYHTQIYHYDSDTNFWREGFLFKPGLKQIKLNKLFYSYQKKLYQYTGKIK